MTEQEQVFLCYAKEDSPSVRHLYNDLVQHGLRVWFDEKSLRPGQDWDAEITKAIRSSRVFLACLSATAVTKKGFVHRELREAQRVHQEYAEGSIFLIPVLLEPCDVPESLRGLQWADLSASDGLEFLISTLREVVGIVGDTPQSPLRSRAEALWGGYLVRAKVVDVESGSPIVGAQVELNEVDSTRNQLVLVIERLLLREHLVGRTGSDGAAWFCLARADDMLYLGTRYIVSATAHGYGTRHAALQYAQMINLLVRTVVARRAGLVFDSAEVGDLDPDEEVVLALPRIKGAT